MTVLLYIFVKKQINQDISVNLCWYSVVGESAINHTILIHRDHDDHIYFMVRKTYGIERNESPDIGAHMPKTICKQIRETIALQAKYQWRTNIRRLISNFKWGWNKCYLTDFHCSRLFWKLKILKFIWLQVYWVTRNFVASILLMKKKYHIFREKIAQKNDYMWHLSTFSHESWDYTDTTKHVSLFLRIVGSICVKIEELYVRKQPL